MRQNPVDELAAVAAWNFDTSLNELTIGSVGMPSSVFGAYAVSQAQSNSGLGPDP
jgi:hypothetical protein